MSGREKRNTALPVFPPDPPQVVMQTARGYRAENACVICRRTDGGPADCIAWLGCQFCGLGFHDCCYFQNLVGPEELAAWKDADGVPPLFMCQGCRS
jgi:hypothetical protein